MMKSIRWGIPIIMLFLAGCAGVHGRPASLRVTISPEKIYPGCVVTALVEAPAGSSEMTGRLDVPGSPIVPLRPSEDGARWSFVTQIPLDAIWQPGIYRVVIEGRGPEQEPLWGEAAIIAP